MHFVPGMHSVRLTNQTKDPNWNWSNWCPHMTNCLNSFFPILVFWESFEDLQRYIIVCSNCDANNNADSVFMITVSGRLYLIVLFLCIVNSHEVVTDSICVVLQILCLCGVRNIFLQFPSRKSLRFSSADADCHVRWISAYSLNIFRCKIINKRKPFQ